MISNEKIAQLKDMYVRMISESEGKTILQTFMVHCESRGLLIFNDNTFTILGDNSNGYEPYFGVTPFDKLEKMIRDNEDEYRFGEKILEILVKYTSFDL